MAVNSSAVRRDLFDHLEPSFVNDLIQEYESEHRPSSLCTTLYKPKAGEVFLIRIENGKVFFINITYYAVKTSVSAISFVYK